MDRYVNVPLSEKDAHSLKAGGLCIFNRHNIYGKRCSAQENAGDSGQRRRTSAENGK